MYIIRNPIQFSWDPNKNRKNIAKHGIDFEDAKKLFVQPFIVDVDERANYNEERMLAYGHLQGQPIVVAYTQPERDTYHLISARLATTSEEKELFLNLNKEKRHQNRDFRRRQKDYHRLEEFE